MVQNRRRVFAGILIPGRISFKESTKNLLLCLLGCLLAKRSLGNPRHRFSFYTASSTSWNIVKDILPASDSLALLPGPDTLPE